MTACPFCEREIAEHKAGEILERGGGRETDRCIGTALGLDIGDWLYPANEFYYHSTKGHISIPHYSTDIRDAMEFIKHICKLLEEKYGGDSNPRCQIILNKNGASVLFRWYRSKRRHEQCGANSNENIALAIVHAGLETYVKLATMKEG